MLNNHNFIEEMEHLEQLKFNQAMTSSLQNSQLNDSNLDLVTLHCRRDHLSSSFHESKQPSCYQKSFSPTKTPIDYNQPDVEKGLYHFRKHQNSTTLLPTLNKVSEGSNYQKSFSPHSKAKDPKAVQKKSNFIKMNWALDPTSSYRKDYITRQSSQWNKDNADRPEYNKLAVFKLHQNPQRDSNYRSNFKPHAIKQEAQIAVRQKDHLASKCKENTPQNSLSEYQRRYDSVMERTKGTSSALGLYAKKGIVRKNS